MYGIDFVLIVVCVIAVKVMLKYRSKIFLISSVYSFFEHEWTSIS